MSEKLEKNDSNSGKRIRIPVLRLSTDICSLQKILDELSRLNRLGKGGYMCVSTVHMVMEAYDSAEFEKVVNNADFVITDGMPLVWMQKLQGEKNARRIRGNDLMAAICEFAEKAELKVGFFGGSENTVAKLLIRIRGEFPALAVAYAFSPPYRKISSQEELEITKILIDSGVQILFVGLGCPKQEKLMAANNEKLSAVMLGVGAAFDFYAGNLKEAPIFMSKLGFEWLYRLYQEPKRLWRRYLILNPRFIVLAGLQLLGLKKFDR